MHVILYIGLVQALFASLVLGVKKPKQPSDKILAAWFLLIAFQFLVEISAVKFANFRFSHSVLLRVAGSLPLIYGPYLYIYARLLISERQVFKKSYWFHFIPFIVFSLSNCILPESVFVLRSGGDITPRLGIKIYMSLVVLSILVYSFVVLRLLKKHETRLHDFFSYSSAKIDLHWLRTAAFSFALAYSFLIVTGLVRMFSRREFITPLIWPDLGLIFFVFAFSYFGFKQSIIFDAPSRNHERNGGRPCPENDSGEEKKGMKYEKSGLSEVKAGRYLDILLRYMEEKKPYLKAELTIQDIARDLGIPKHHLTQVINEKLNKNFYTLVNEYRVEDVKSRMLWEKNKNYTLLAIAYESGFNSKSAFNSIFKKITHMTPTEYRKTHTDPGDLPSAE